MSDNKKWYKTWTSILTDHNHINLSCQQVGQWTRLCAHVATSGERGKLKLTANSKRFFQDLETTWETVIQDLSALPNVRIFKVGETIAENQFGVNSAPQSASDKVHNNDNGEIIVTLKNWWKYQVDSTAVDRMRALRSKLRYKKRGEETSTSTSTPPASRGASLEAPPSALAGNGNGPETADKIRRIEPWKEIPPTERMTPEEMTAIRKKNMGR